MPCQITPMLPLTAMAEMGQITGRLSFLDQRLALPIKANEAQH